MKIKDVIRRLTDISEKEDGQDKYSQGKKDALEDAIYLLRQVKQ